MPHAWKSGPKQRHCAGGCVAERPSGKPAREALPEAGAGLRRGRFVDARQNARREIRRRFLSLKGDL